LENIPPAPRGTPKINVTYDISTDGILNVTAEVENAEGGKKSLTISNDKNRLSQDEIDRMLKEAERFKEEDEKIIEDRNSVNNYENILYTNLGSVKEKGVKEMEDEIQKELDWLHENQNLTKDEVSKRQKEFMEHMNKYMGEAKETEQAPNMEQFGTPPTENAEQNKETVIDEVD
jgi:molecular chaperone DnaK (HSP70)